MTHYKELCQYGWLHAQCRCPGPKEVRRVECDLPHRHRPEPIEIVVVRP